jgi:DNA invertase Pin-like site-specific DNA recombinase
MPEAISYVRWSSQEQGKGNSEVRQTEGAAKWLKEHPNYILNRRLRFRDAGVSGRGDHMEGALGAFRDAAISKKVFKPGTVLLVEALDRLGRMEPVDQLTLFLQIITTAEIIVVTTMDGEEYSRETMKGASGQMRLMKSLMKMHLAWEESDKKAERSGDNWKRIRSGEKKRVGTKCVPGWIGISSDGERYELIPERVRVVREIFELTVAGWGKDRIAKKLRDDKVECWGIRLKKATRWRDSYVAKILANPAVIGQFQWHKSPTYDSKTGKKVREPIGEPQNNFFPAAIKHSLWAAVQKIRASRASRPGRVGTEVRNLFTGLVYCGHTGDTMCFSNKTPHYYIKSSALKAPKGVRLKPWIYEDFEDAFFSFVGRLDPSGLVEPSSAPEREALLERIAELGSAKDSLTKKINRLIALDGATKSVPEVGVSLLAADHERSVVTAQIREYRAVIILTSNDQLDSFEDRLLARVKSQSFTSQGLATNASTWLAKIAAAEGISISPTKIRRIVKLAKNNLRQALQDLEVFAAEQTPGLPVITASQMTISSRVQPVANTGQAALI